MLTWLQHLQITAVFGLSFLLALWPIYYFCPSFPLRRWPVHFALLLEMPLIIAATFAGQYALQAQRPAYWTIEVLLAAACSFIYALVVRPRASVTPNDL